MEDHEKLYKAIPSTFAGPGDGGLIGIASDGPRLAVTGRTATTWWCTPRPTPGGPGGSGRQPASGGFGYQSGVPVFDGAEVVVVGRDGPDAGIWVGPAP